MKNPQNNFKKLQKRELKTILGGNPPFGCMRWNPFTECCKLWDSGHKDNPTCPE